MTVTQVLKKTTNIGFLLQLLETKLPSWFYYNNPQKLKQFIRFKPFLTLYIYCKLTIVYFDDNISTHNQNSKTNNAHKKTNHNLLFIKKNRAIYYHTSQSSTFQVQSLSNFGSLFTSSFSIRNVILNFNLLQL